MRHDTGSRDQGSNASSSSQAQVLYISSLFTRVYPLHSVNIIAEAAGRRWSDQSNIRVQR